MKTNISKMTGLFAGLVLAVSGAALAGSKFPGNGSVTITKNADGSGTAVGLLSFIYNAPTQNEFFGCQAYVTGGLYCQVKNEAGVHVVCTSSSAFLGNAVRTMSPDVRVTLRWNASGQCTYLAVMHSSEYQDKQG
jgi:hypothetical protein